MNKIDRTGGGRGVQKSLPRNIPSAAAKRGCGAARCKHMINYIHVLHIRSMYIIEEGRGQRGGRGRKIVYQKITPISPFPYIELKCYNFIGQIFLTSNTRIRTNRHLSLRFHTTCQNSFTYNFKTQNSCFRGLFLSVFLSGASIIGLLKKQLISEVKSLANEI